MMKALLENWKRHINESQLKLGYNDFRYGRVDIARASSEYSELDLDNYLAISDIETYESGHFRNLMQAIEEFAKKNGYAGIVLRAETQDKSRISQDALEELYKKLGYNYYSTDAYEESDVFMIKRL
jgi:hypothetical protein